MRSLKRFILNLLVFPLTIKGFTKAQAKKWLRAVKGDLTIRNGIPLRKKIWSYSHGFISTYVVQHNINEENYREFISQRDYRYLRPMNEKYDKWINDKITIRNIFKPFSDYLPECYYQISPRENEKLIIPLLDCPKGYGDKTEDIIRLIKEKKTLTLTTSDGYRNRKLSYKDGKYFIDDEKKTLEEIKTKLLSSRRVRLITEYIEPSSIVYLEPGQKPAELKLYIINSEGDNPIIGDAFLLNKIETGNSNEVEEGDNDEIETEDEIEGGDGRINRWTPVNVETGQYHYCSTLGKEINGVIPYFDEIKEQISKLCLFVPQIEYMGATVIITENGFKFQWFTPTPSYPFEQRFSEVTVSYLSSVIVKKKKEFKGIGVRVKQAWKRIHLQVRRKFSRLFFPKGLFPYLSTRWISVVCNDFLTNKDATFKEKMWAYKHGFLSYRLKQYGITEENHLNYISDFEYNWLRHINGKHRIWFEDKITIKYILSEFKDCFPEYYYYITVKNGKNKIIPMMDCPDEYGAGYEDIFNLAMNKKVLALKPDEGSHGEGFYKLSYQDGKFYLNSEEATKERIKELLEDVNNQYLVTEYIQMHSELKRIYPNSVNTIRLTVFKKDGKTPVIGNGYMRFGSSRTGVVDNVGAGGIGVDIDVETGRFFNARIKNDSTLIPCPIHPDTGEKIEGYLPNWEQVKKQILEISAAVPQVEYLGFDIALTEDGIKFPEINRFPDFPRINPLTPRTMDYLVYKLEKRKEKYGYTNDNMPFRIVNLPKRGEGK